MRISPLSRLIKKQKIPGAFHVNIKIKKGIASLDIDSLHYCSAQNGTVVTIILMMIFHLAGCGRIYALVPSPYRNAEANAAAQGDKAAGDHADPYHVMYESGIFTYKIHYYLIHRWAPMRLL
jgi:hypothetical protein